MKRFHQAAKLLDLSPNELAVLDLLPLYRTPLLLAKQSGIPRPTIYVTIEKLHGRGLIQRKKLNNKFFWELSPIEDIEFNISKLRSNVSDKPPITKGKEIAVTKDNRIRILNGKEAMIDIFMSAIKDHKGERLRAIQGENIGNSWDKVLGSATINRINKAIKDNDLITEIITTKRWLELGTKVSGVEWARNL